MSLTSKNKISPAFEPFLADTRPSEKRDAIVIFRAPPNQAPRPRGRLRSLKKRLDAIKARADAQRSVQDKSLARYQRAGAGGRRSTEGDLAVSTIGNSALPVARVEVTRQSLPALAEQKDVLAILPNQKIRLIAPKKIDSRNLQRAEKTSGLTWGLKTLGIPELWQTTRGDGINVAVLDTGVYAEHSALANRVKNFVIIDPLGRRIEAKPAFDGGSHGTHVCGTIAGGTTPDGVSIGVAPEAQLLVGAVLVGDATLRTLVEGISWAVENGADVINMSLGFTYFEPLFGQLFDVLIDQFGVLPVVAVGNENHGNTSSPGNAPNALSVGAVEKLPRGKTDVAFFSSGASLVFPGDPNAGLVNKPDLVAPGVQVYSAIPPEQTPHGTVEYTYMDGSSMATPHVAGVAALLMAAKPTAPVRDVIQALRETAKHPGGEALRPDNRWGFGLIQPKDALAGL
jgi:subtilisin family serine protease